PHSFLTCFGAPRHLHSFPTRRSSDLARVPRKKVSLPVAAVAQGQELGVRPAAELRIGSFERNHRGRSRRDERHGEGRTRMPRMADRKSTRLNSSHVSISYAVFCLKKK